MNMLDYFSKTWNYFWSCSNSVELTLSRLQLELIVSRLQQLEVTLPRLQLELTVLRLQLELTSLEWFCLLCLSSLYHSSSMPSFLSFFLLLLSLYDYCITFSHFTVFPSSFLPFIPIDPLSAFFTAISSQLDKIDIRILQFRAHVSLLNRPLNQMLWHNTNGKSTYF